jgi:hypothetical protein
MTSLGILDRSRTMMLPRLWEVLATYFSALYLLLLWVYRSAPAVVLTHAGVWAAAALVLFVLRTITLQPILRIGMYLVFSTLLLAGVWIDAGLLSYLWGFFLPLVVWLCVLSYAGVLLVRLTVRHGTTRAGP